MSMAAPMMSAASTNPTVMRFAIFCSPVISRV
jgi:hypothetical protein